MLFDVKGKFKYKNDGYNQRLKLIIKFKLEGKIFRVKLTRIVASTTWIGHSSKYQYRSYEDFQKDIISYLTKKELVEAEVKHMIIKYLEEQEDDDLIKSNEKKIKELLKDNKFNIKINLTRGGKENK